MVAVPMFEPSTDESDNAPLGQFVGVVACTLKLDTVTEKSVTSLNSAEREHTFLIDNRNTVLWAPDNSLFGENLMDEAAGFPAFQQIVVLFDQRTPQNPSKINLCSEVSVETARTFMQVSHLRYNTFCFSIALLRLPFPINLALNSNVTALYTF